ncbi:hypothetical protein EDD22DRAFT_734859, partial [Suillus occidentalis]
AQFYLDRILWITQGGDFKSLVDLQDEYRDTVLNIAAHVGNSILVRTLIDIGVKQVLPNKAGLRPGDPGIEVEVHCVNSVYVSLVLEFGSPRSLMALHCIIMFWTFSASAPIQKSQDIIGDMTSMIQELSTEFSTEINGKQDSLDV